MVAIDSVLLAAFLGGYIVGDSFSPIRRSVYAALKNMETAIEQDVEEAEGE